MKKIFKTLTFLVIFTIAVVNLSVITSKADKLTTKNLFKELSKVTDNQDLKRYLKENVNLESTNLLTEEFYVKVYETEETIIDDKIYTEEEYLLEKSKSRAVINPTNWIKFTYQISPQTTTKSSMLVEYEWINRPYYQFKDIFTVSSNASTSLPGSNSLVWFSYWPNKAATNVVGTYNNFDNPEKYKFNSLNGFSVLHDIKTTDQKSSIWSKIQAIPKTERDKYFYYEAETTVTKLGYVSKGTPKGSLVFNIDSPTTNGNTCNILFTYNHKKFSVDFVPSIGIDGNGLVSISGLTAGMTYDKASSSIKYTWNTTIN